MSTDPFQSPLEFIKQAEQNSPSEEQVADNILDNLPPEIREVIKSLQGLPGRVVIQGGNNEHFEIPLGKAPEAGIGRGGDMMAAAMEKMKRLAPFTKQKDPEFLAAVEDLGRFAELVEDLSTTPVEDMLNYLDKLGVTRALADTLLEGAAMMVHGFMEDVFNEQTVEKLVAETDLLESFTLLAAGFFTVGMRTERLKAERARDSEVRGSTAAGDPPSAEDSGGAG